MPLAVTNLCERKKYLHFVSILDLMDSQKEWDNKIGIPLLHMFVIKRQ